MEPQKSGSDEMRVGDLARAHPALTDTQPGHTLRL